MPAPDLSLVTSLYQSDRYLHRYETATIAVLEELSAQRVGCEVVVIMNDPSRRERRGMAWLAERARSIDGASVRLVEVQRESLYASWNRGVRTSRGTVVGFWNADDVRCSGALAEGVERVRAGADVVYFPWMILTTTGLLGHWKGGAIAHDPPRFSEDLFGRSMEMGPFFVVRRSAFDEVGYFNEEFRVAGDFEWESRAVGRLKFVRGECIAGVFLSDGRGLSASRSAAHEREDGLVYDRAGVPAANRTDWSRHVADQRPRAGWLADALWLAKTIGKRFGMRRAVRPEGSDAGRPHEGTGEDS